MLADGLGAPVSRPASRPTAAKLPALRRPVAGTRNEDGAAEHARTVAAAPTPLAAAPCGRMTLGSFARCAGDAGLETGAPSYLARASPGFLAYCRYS